jgi:hypothetical protein
VPNTPPLRDEFLRVRIEGVLKQRIARAYSLYGVTEATLVRDAVIAALDYMEAQEGYKRPIQMILNTEAFHAAAEDPAPYEHGPTKAKPPKPPDKSGRTRGAGPGNPVRKSA